MGLENVQLCCFLHPSDWGSLTTCVLTSCDPIKKNPHPSKTQDHKICCLFKNYAKISNFKNHIVGAIF